jgi:hypothetical protein
MTDKKGTKIKFSATFRYEFIKQNFVQVYEVISRLTYLGTGAPDNYIFPPIASGTR